MNVKPTESFGTLNCLVKQILFFPPNWDVVQEWKDLFAITKKVKVWGKLFVVLY